jgi:hypothetical protein
VRQHETGEGGDRPHEQEWPQRGRDRQHARDGDQHQARQQGEEQVAPSGDIEGVEDLHPQEQLGEGELQLVDGGRPDTARRGEEVEERGDDTDGEECLERVALLVAGVVRVGEPARDAECGGDAQRPSTDALREGRRTGGEHRHEDRNP